MIDIQQVITEHGMVFRPGNQNVKDLLAKLREKSKTEALYNLLPSPNGATLVDKAVTETQTVLQAFQSAFTPKGGITVTPSKIELFQMKIDAQENPSHLEASWLGFMADQDETDRRKWPFSKWWTNNLAIQGQHDLEMNEIFKGVYVAPTAGVPGSTGASMNGLKKLINTAIANGEIIPIVMGTPPSDPVDFVNYVEAFVKQIPDLLKGEIDVLQLSRENEELFREGMDKKYNLNYGQVSDVSFVRYTNIKVVGLASMIGSKKLIATPKWNRAGFGIRPQAATVFQLEAVDRNLKAWTDFWKGFGYWIRAYVMTNDQDLS
jgi:hypothetical protein